MGMVSWGVCEGITLGRRKEVKEESGREAVKEREWYGE